MRCTQLTLPYLDKELLDLYYSKLQKNLNTNETLYDNNLSIKNILIHANNDPKSNMVRVNHIDGKTTMLSYADISIRPNYFTKYNVFASSIYQDNKNAGTIRIHSMTNNGKQDISAFITDITDNLLNDFKNHLGVIKILLDLYESSVILNFPGSIYINNGKSREIRNYIDNSYRYLHSDVAFQAEFIHCLRNGISFSANKIYEVMNSINIEKREHHPVIKFDEDKQDKAEHWNHTLAEIVYSKELAEKIKKTLA